MRGLATRVLFALALTAYSNSAVGQLRDFVSDGCSWFPDGQLIGNSTLWCDCCVAHDLAYWAGGTPKERKQADELLKECVLERSGNAALATLMYHGVRAGGHPRLPSGFRWGYGWPYGRGYQSLSDLERVELHAKLEAYLQRPQPLACPR